MRFKYFSVLYFTYFLLNGSIFADQKRSAASCKDIEAIVLSKRNTDVYTAKDLKNVADVMFKNSGCDDGVYGEGASDIVGQSLANDFRSVINMIESEPRMKSFILKHIDATANENDLEKIIKMRSKCKSYAAKDACLSIVDQAEKALSDVRRP